MTICEMCADTADDQCVHCVRADRDRLREALRTLDVEMRQQGFISERVGRHIIKKALTA